MKYTEKDFPNLKFVGEDIFPLEADISKAELEEIGDAAREAGLKLSNNFSMEAEALEIKQKVILEIKGATVGRKGDK